MTGTSCKIAAKSWIEIQLSLNDRKLFRLVTPSDHGKSRPEDCGFNFDTIKNMLCLAAGGGRRKKSSKVQPYYSCYDRTGVLPHDIRLPANGKAKTKCG